MIAYELPSNGGKIVQSLLGSLHLITVVLADDHNMFRQGLRMLLESESGFRVIGEAADGLKTSELVRELHPDVLVLDLMLAGVNGIEVCRQVVKISPRTSVVMLSMYGVESYVIEALRSG